MTLDEAINELQEDIELYIPLHGTIDDVDRELPDGRLITALEMAIKSLEAWEKVKAEIEVERADCQIYKLHYAFWDGEDYAYKECLNIIDKHLQEVTTDADRN